jgi:hypothetical protein
MSPGLVERVRRYHHPPQSFLVAFLLLSTAMFAYLGEWFLAVLGAFTTCWLAYALYRSERRWRDTTGGGDR